MVEVREDEAAVALPERVDAGVYFIGVIRTPWTARADCPRQGDPVNGPDCRIELDGRWVEALTGVEPPCALFALYFMHEARRDLVHQRPRGARAPLGTFALRSPVRPNPIALAKVHVLAREGATLHVRGLDCLDGTPLLDLKPERCPNAAT